MRCLQIVDRFALPNGVQELSPSFAYFWADPGEYRCRVSPLDYGCLHLMSNISTRLRVSTLDIRYLQSITGVYTRCSLSPFAYGCLHSMSGISNRLRVSTLDIRYFQWIMGVYTWCPVSPIDYRVYTRCPVSPLDYGCLHLMSNISTRLRVSTLDIRYLQSITGVYTRYPIFPVDYGCLHLMSAIASRLQGLHSMSGISTLLRMSTLDVRYLHSITSVDTRCPVSPFDYGCLQSMPGISSQLRVSSLDTGSHTRLHMSTFYIPYLNSITGVYTRCRCQKLKGFGTLGAVTTILWRVGVEKFNSQLPELPMA